MKFLVASHLFPIKEMVFSAGSGQSSFMDKQEPYGIGGWLILPMIGLMITPLRLAFVLYGTFLPIFTNGSWGKLTDSTSSIYHPLWGPLIIFEMLGNLFFIVFALWLLLLLFQKDSWFPKMIIAFYSLNAAFVGLDILTSFLIPFLAERSHAAEMNEFIRSMVAAMIWIPYFLKSKRVQNTFREKMPAESSLTPA